MKTFDEITGQAVRLAGLECPSQSAGHGFSEGAPVLTRLLACRITCQLSALCSHDPSHRSLIKLFGGQTVPESFELSAKSSVTGDA
ncbi:hypothetical protein [Henriciella mobilis]|uniref:hypothetical protein n=1 Tax=Henriciella mobilis TaxID=2305467 RepID=UPI0011C3755F|nr:hypothetical protein [Henriciella mobilis]